MAIEKTAFLFGIVPIVCCWNEMEVTSGIRETQNFIKKNLQVFINLF